MEVKDLFKAIAYYEVENYGKALTVIQISPKDFHDLALDKNSLKHIQLLEDEHGIICHQFNGIPLVITKEVDTIKIM